MESNYYTDEFEQLIKEKADQFRMYPSKRVWHSIYNNLHPSRRWPSYVISILFFTSLILVGYLNTSDNSANTKFGKGRSSSTPADNNSSKNNDLITKNSSDRVNTNNVNYTLTGPGAFTTQAPVKNETGKEPGLISVPSEKSLATSPVPGNNNRRQPVQELAKSNNSNQLVAGIATSDNKDMQKVINPPATTKVTGEEETDERDAVQITGTMETIASIKTTVEGTNAASLKKEDKHVADTDEKSISLQTNTDKQQEKSWIENFALQNKPAGSKWKSRLDYEFYATPAVNYRKLTTDSKGSAAPFATTGDINKSISQKPGLGIEAGAGISYAFAKNLRLKAGIQFNYTSYNINADQTNHPILTSILLTDPATGYSYPAPRTSTIANAYDNNALQPVTLHNRTYQVSIPVGLAYKLSSHRNVEWFAGATVQPSYIFGGNAHLISSDLKNYVSDPSSIRNWNLNLGFETFMNYKLGAYSLRVGPQVRYQVYSTYRKDIALIEKPYAVGLKIGLVKGF